MKKYFFFFLFTLSAASAASMTRLESTDFEKLERGEVLLRSREIKNSPWPERFLFTLVDASPLEVAAVFAGYEYQPKYVPNLIYAKVKKHKGPLNTIVDYEIDVPWPLSNAVYTQYHTIARRGADLLVFWQQLKSNQTKKNEGSAHFKKYKNKTLITYNSIVVPTSSFAGLIESKSRRDLIEFVKILKNEVQTLKSKRPAKLKELVDLFKRALAGNEVYSK